MLEQIKHGIMHALVSLFDEMKLAQEKIWDSVKLKYRFSELEGKPLKSPSSSPLPLASKKLENLDVISASGCCSITPFPSNSAETLKKATEVLTQNMVKKCDKI